MVSENISTLPSNVGGEDIVRASVETQRCRCTRLHAAGKGLRPLLNITELVS